MKKIIITLVGLLLLVTFGCSNDEKKESTEKTDQTKMETQNPTVPGTNDAVVNPENKNSQMSDEAVQKPKKKPTIEGC